MMLLSAVSVAVAVGIVARERPGRFLLVRVADAERHRAGTRRVHALNALVLVAAVAIVLLGREERIQAIAVVAATFALPLWMLVEIRLAVRSAPPAPVPSRFRVSLETPP